MTCIVTVQSQLLWRRSHLDMLDLSKGGRIRRGGKIWPETVHCRNYITTQFQIYFEYKVFRGYYNFYFQNSNCFSS